LLYVFIWWLTLQILGWVVLPLAYGLFKWLPDRGYTFAKSLGLLLVSYVLWLGASLGYLRNDLGGIFVAIALVAGGSVWLYSRHRHDDESRGGEIDSSLLTFLREHKGLVLTVEILFAVAFCVWATLRAYAPDKIMSSGGEKFMEIAFLSAILKSPQFPPHDPWLSGFAISYYYFGYVMMALLTRLSGVSSGVGFDLYDALLFALTVTGTFGVAYNLVAGGRKAEAESGRSPSSNRQPIFYGVLGSLFVAVMGNLEGLLEALYAKGVVPGAFWSWIDIPDLIERGRVTGSWYPGHSDWWWWRASRVLRDRDFLGRPMPISPIDEFPFFSFLLGDNHPHVLALPFVLLALALALNLLRHQLVIGAKRKSQVSWWNPVAACLNGDWALFILYALILGALGFLNTWDFPIYLALTILAYGVGRYAATGETTLELLRRMVMLGMGLLLAGVLCYMPFYVTFRSQAGGVLPYLLPPTRLPQYLVMFGPFTFIIAWFLITRLLREAVQETGEYPLRSVVRWWGLVALAPFVLLVLVVMPVLFTEQGHQFVQDTLVNPDVQQALGSTGPGAAMRAILISRLRDPWLFLMLSFLIALAAVSIVRRGQSAVKSLREREYHRLSASDFFASLLILAGLTLTLSMEFIYLRDSFGVRMNTVFKFYYQGWVMMGCASAYGVWWVLNGRERAVSGAGRPVFLVGVVILVAAGMVYPLMAGYSRVHGFQREPNLDGSVNIARTNPDDWAAIEWLQANAQGVPVILEAPGLSYNYESRISAFTGFPTVLGWSLHEGQWRGDYIEQGKREPDIATIYTTYEGERALELLHKWGVDYVIVGAMERQYVERLCSAPDRPCHPAEALKKFDVLLEPVFAHGQTTVYSVDHNRASDNL
jgi:YYY domain-containing protein